ncbi:MAG: hypothetical protein CL910_16555 [Deltaproteobacteria bacterium]|jgi:hypothetical protein|nr:hypothetical protein [Deltaproteobacteria bacterium]
MRRRLWARLGLLCGVLWLGLADSAQAVTVHLVVSPRAPGVLHDATRACDPVPGHGRPCREGRKAGLVTGTLVAERAGARLDGIRGVLTVSGGPDIQVTDGRLDFARAGDDPVIGWLMTSSHGTFRFLDPSAAGGRSALSSTGLWLDGVNGEAALGRAGGWGLRLQASVAVDLQRARVAEAPLPLLLLGASLAVRRGRRTGNSSPWRDRLTRRSKPA